MERLKNFYEEAWYRQYTIPLVQSRVDDCEPENMYNNADGCGTRPICAFTANCKKKQADWEACKAASVGATANVDNALAEALRKKSQSSGSNLGLILGITGIVAALGAGAYFILKK